MVQHQLLIANPGYYNYYHITIDATLLFEYSLLHESTYYRIMFHPKDLIGVVYESQSKGRCILHN
ncbi:hypothetical protein [Bacillus infantis]|uniref:hypothetical protein n=1 Tax=Bacillus infantis TaxID=324767 RepID=UPI0020A071DB|nr:hypothetical protein [Bacillus infantis]MCP1161203.1 hypothetical protein [Bacillus infantis]